MKLTGPDGWLTTKPLMITHCTVDQLPAILSSGKKLNIWRRVGLYNKTWDEFTQLPQTLMIQWNLQKPSTYSLCCFFSHSPPLLTHANYLHRDTRELPAIISHIWSNVQSLKWIYCLNSSLTNLWPGNSSVNDNIWQKHLYLISNCHCSLSKSTDENDSKWLKQHIRKKILSKVIRNITDTVLIFCMACVFHLNYHCTIIIDKLILCIWWAVCCQSVFKRYLTHAASVHEVHLRSVIMSTSTFIQAVQIR